MHFSLITRAGLSLKSPKRRHIDGVLLHEPTAHSLGCSETIGGHATICSIMVGIFFVDAIEFTRLRPVLISFLTCSTAFWYTRLAHGFHAVDQRHG